VVFAAHDQPIVGDSDVWKYVMYRIEQVASTNATVLLLGETGTGKDVAARAIHDRSPRCHKSFVVVDCGALPQTLIESELFGRERGAFTGAHVSQPGRFELANGGTVFLGTRSAPCRWSCNPSCSASAGRSRRAPRLWTPDACRRARHRGNQP
jgi:transcriptional regulator with GAF, ATPase, and Fis domain